MRLAMSRFQFTETETISRFSIDGAPYCYALEPTVREIAGMPVESWKVPGRTAMPCGLFHVTIDWSTRFRCLMPHVLNVPGFDGVRIHPGNTWHDTEACPCVGRNLEPHSVTGSWEVFPGLVARMQETLLAGLPVMLLVSMGDRSTPV
jgi:hypothetical protein